MFMLLEMWILAFIASAIFVLSLTRCSTRNSASAPGPMALPIIGHLHLLIQGPAPNILFAQLAHKYGPIMSLKFGSVPIIVASTMESAKEFLKTYDTVFASRPPAIASRLLFHHKDLALAPYGERWRQLRRICTLELFTSHRVETFKKYRVQEVKYLLADLTSHIGQIVDVRANVTATTFNVISQILMGKRYCGSNVEDKKEAEQFMHLFDEILSVMGTFPASDYLPYLRWLDPGKVEARYKAVSKAVHSCLEKIVKDHEENRPQQEDFIDILLKLRDQGEECLQERGTIPSLFINLIGGGTDTSSVVVEWALAELIKHPSSMAKLQEEIASIIEVDEFVDESDVPRLPYLQAVVKETFRLHPPATLLLPHYSMDSCEVMGYKIAKGTTVLVNAYAIGRDASVWEDPLEFRPERFLNSQIDFRGQHFELVPFGAGRRVCAGISMGIVITQMTLANMVHAFDWRMPPGEDVDTINERYGLTVVMANKLRAIPNARSCG